METPLTLDAHFFAPLKATFEEPGVKAHWRSCFLISDEVFLTSGVSRVLENVQSGRDWVQQLRRLHGLDISAANYFAQLESSRRLAFAESVSQALELAQITTLRAQTDRLAFIPELAGIESLGA